MPTAGVQGVGRSVSRHFPRHTRRQRSRFVNRPFTWPHPVMSASCERAPNQALWSPDFTDFRDASNSSRGSDSPAPRDVYGSLFSAPAAKEAQGWPGGEADNSICSCRGKEIFAQSSPDLSSLESARCQLRRTSPAQMLATPSPLSARGWISPPHFVGAGS